jgi:hypothetical protein
MACDPNRCSTVKLFFLRGEETPQLKQETDFDTDDMKMAVRHTLVAKAIGEERRIFQLNLSAIAGQRAALQLQISQANKAIGSYNVRPISTPASADRGRTCRQRTALGKRYTSCSAATSWRSQSACMAASPRPGRASSRRGIRTARQMLVLDDGARSPAGAEPPSAKPPDRAQAATSSRRTPTPATNRAPHGGIVDKLALPSAAWFRPAKRSWKSCRSTIR